MKKINSIEFNATATLNFENLEVPDDVYDALFKIYNRYGGILTFENLSEKNMSELSTAFEWLSENAFVKKTPFWYFDIFHIK
jgi:hypothetical protein